MRILGFFVAAMVLSATPLYGQDVIESEPLTIGTSYLVETHEAERKVHVVTPQGYYEGKQAYPVVIMMIRTQYRDDGRAFLMGESAAGHFVIETWVNTPDLFNGYAALSPSLQWNGQQLSRHFVDMGETERPPLFISLANEGGETEEGITRLVAKVRSDMCYSDRRNDLVHANTLHGLLPEALQYLLPTEAAWLDEYGLTLRCETGRDASFAD